MKDSLRFKKKLIIEFFSRTSKSAVAPFQQQGFRSEVREPNSKPTAMG